MPFLDLNTDIKPWLGITDTSQDAFLTTINNAMEQSIINFCENDFTIKTSSDILDGNGSDIILPLNTPITEVIAVYFNCDTDGSNGTLIDPHYYLMREYEIALRGYKTPFARARIRVDYKWGYNGLPADVKLCMLQAVEAEWRRKVNKAIGGLSRSKKDESDNVTSDLNEWDYKTGLPKVLVFKLNPYKVFEFPRQPMATRNW